MIWSLLAEKQQVLTHKARQFNISWLAPVPTLPEGFGKQEILALTCHDRILCHWVCQWQNKQITWEQATYGVICNLLLEKQHYLASASGCSMAS